MNCHKCGASNREDARFCTTCGSELLIPTKADEKEQRQEQLIAECGAQSTFIGVFTCVFSIFFGILLLPVSIKGLKNGLKAKDELFGKIGLIINIVNIVIQVFSTFILLPILIFVIKDLFNNDRYAYKYICSDYGEVEITDNIVFDLKKDKTFTLSYEYPDGNGIIKGKYSIQNVHGTIDDGKSSYEYDIKLNADTRVIDNELIEGDYQTKYKLTLDDNEIILENKISKNKYTCKKAN